MGQDYIERAGVTMTAPLLSDPLTCPVSALPHHLRPNKSEIAVQRRDKLFEMINELPTCYEVVSGKAREAGKQTPVSRKRPSAPPGPSRFSQHPRTSVVSSKATAPEVAGSGWTFRLVAWCSVL